MIMLVKAYLNNRTILEQIKKKHFGVLVGLCSAAGKLKDLIEVLAAG